ncbi:flagellar basal body P-ring formation chaperone FlgA [Roseospira visakhapatnamensis]|uniref:Flagella basal body P-ring formation protein FlgA n=1 Tax=Roseospira visakhapatnamensis TaxID=390880 RepID=A0A7W6WA12_9PROT|nr:flagellar basal body P-ring formation chaperone FlgA [Roseospira visakhapatnamensis]MBB4266720.1 flagella basal body P-ring formation protein FlgA [Roseospira visakhapatnamensis]
MIRSSLTISARAAALALAGLLAATAPARAAEVILPVDETAATPAAVDGARTDTPDIVALAEALVDAATRRAALAPPAQPARAATLAPGSGLRASLRPETEIERDVILLGDVFGGLPPEAARVPVAHAPEPGQRLLLDAGYLETLATEYGVNWTPVSRFVQAEVARRGYEVGRPEVMTALRQRLVQAGMPVDGAIVLNALNVRAMVGSPEAARVRVRDLYYDERTRRFNALLEIPADAPNARSVRLTGSVHVAVEVPVLARPMRREMVITEDDLRWDEVRDTDLRPDILLDPADLVGHMARNGIQAGRPVRANQVRLPDLVRRNDLVTMVVETPFMTVTARGRALESGALGQTVRVSNLVSDKELLAVVQGRNTVAVRPELLAAAR